MSYLLCLMRNNKNVLIILSLLFLFPLVNSAHYIVGYVEDAIDGESANNHIVALWNVADGPGDNLTDIVGINGNSGTSNVYMIDCEMLTTPCIIGDNLTISLIDSGGGYVDRFDVNVTVTSAGFDLVSENMSLNSLPSFEYILVDDSFNFTLNEIDLLTNSVLNVVCSAVIREYDADSLSGFHSEFYDNVNSSFGSMNDNNNHYTNSSCFVNSSYGDLNQTEVICSFDVYYYANSEDWNCEINVTDGIVVTSGVDSTFVNQLLSIEVIDTANFTVSSSGSVSNETEIVIKNAGNVQVDLGLSGYGESVGDGYAMSCNGGSFIDIFYKKYNLMSSVVGNLSLSEFELNYINLTANTVNEDFNLTQRHNDVVSEAFKSTFWRVYVPEEISDLCIGNIVIGAVVSE